MLVGELVQLLAPLADLRGGLLERVAAAGADLDLGGDQLADEMLLERRALRGRLQVLEAVRSGRASPGSRTANSSSTASVKSCAVLELLAGEADLLVRGEALGVSQGALH